MHLNTRGFTLLEVLITLIVLAIGLLGLANLQSKVHTAELESYQRAQAVLLLQDMVDRLSVSLRTDTANYVTGTASPLGTGDSQPTSCTALAATGAARDQCEWSNNLKGAAESTGGTSVGAMIGARGCIELLQVRNETPGVCTPGIYRVSVVWQGMVDTVAPNLRCGAGQYGREPLRRLISSNVTIGTPGCAPP